MPNELISAGTRAADAKWAERTGRIQEEDLAPFAHVHGPALRRLAHLSRHATKVQEAVSAVMETQGILTAELMMRGGDLEAAALAYARAVGVLLAAIDAMLGGPDA